MVEILTAADVAELLRLSSNRVLLLARRGEIPSLVIDGRARFDAGEIEEWLKSRRNIAIVSSPPKVVNDD